MNNWEGKVAVVVGASSGMGRAIAIRLAADGMKVAALARREGRLRELERRSECQGRLHGYVCDVTDESLVVDVFSKILNDLGKIRVLVNSAGVFHFTEFKEFEVEKWKDMTESIFFGKFIAIKHFIKSVDKDDPEKMFIININSIMPLSELDLDWVHLCITELPAIMMTESLILDLMMNNYTNIKVTGFDPGFVWTELINTYSDKTISEEKKEKFDITAYLQPEDIADTVVMILTTSKNVNISRIRVEPHGLSGFYV